MPRAADLCQRRRRLGHAMRRSARRDVHLSRRHVAARRRHLLGTQPRTWAIRRRLPDTVRNPCVRCVTSPLTVQTTRRRCTRTTTSTRSSSATGTVRADAADRADRADDEHAVLMQHFLSIANPGGAEPVPSAASSSSLRIAEPADSGLMYFAHRSTWLPGFNENATLPFTPGKTYRLRIINVRAQ